MHYIDIVPNLQPSVWLWKDNQEKRKNFYNFLGKGLGKHDQELIATAKHGKPRQAPALGRTVGIIGILEVWNESWCTFMYEMDGSGYDVRNESDEWWIMGMQIEKCSGEAI